MKNKEINQLVKKFSWIFYTGTLFFVLLAYWLLQQWLNPQEKGFSFERSDLIQTVAASGRVQTPEYLEISSKFTGKVISIPVAEGQTVRTGQTLLVLESIEERAIVEQAKVLVIQAAARLRKIRELTQPLSEQTLVKAQATLEVAKKQYAKTRELSEKSYVSLAQVDDSLRNLAIAQSQLTNAKYQARSLKETGSDYARAESALKQAQANERSARAKLGKMLIEAESDGVLISRDVEPGNVVTTGKTLMVMAPTGKLQLVAKVDGKNLRHLKIGQHAVVIADAYPGQRFDAELSYINPAVDLAREIAEVKLDVPAPPEYLRRDMIVSIDIEVAERVDALKLSSVAVRMGDRR